MPLTNLRAYYHIAKREADLTIACVAADEISRLEEWKDTQGEHSFRAHWLATQEINRIRCIYDKAVTDPDRAEADLIGWSEHARILKRILKDRRKAEVDE
jgi:hypothetical protein